MPVRPIDYTNLGYDALREAMLAVAAETLPEWTDTTQGDMGVLLVELFAYANDITQYYQTRIANNLFPATADEPDAMVQLLRLIGYELRPPTPATVELRVAFDASQAMPLTIPAGTTFVTALSSGTPLTWETPRDVVVHAIDLTPPAPAPPDTANLRYFQPVPVVQGRTINDDPNVISDGRPSQLIALRQKPVVPGSVQATVQEPGGDTLWLEVETLARSSPSDRVFVVQRDATGAATILFGDGVNGMVPPAGTSATPVLIRTVYRAGGGSEANVPPNTAFRAASSPMAGVIRDARNPLAAAGGAPAEDVDRARLFAPRLFRTQERAVTASDYVDLALQIPGVGKAQATAVSWNRVVLAIAPAGGVTEPSELLVRDVLGFFETRRMASVQLKVVSPNAVDVFVSLTVHAQPYFLKSDVEAAVQNALDAYLAFDAVAFGQTLFLSRVYDVVQELPQVVSLNVTQFTRSAGGAIDPDGVIALGPSELPRLAPSALGRITVIGGRPR